MSGLDYDVSVATGSAAREREVDRGCDRRTNVATTQVVLQPLGS